MEKYVIGLDFGTLSVRAAIVKVNDGTEIIEKSSNYLNGVMDTKLTAGPDPNFELPNDWALQYPNDYIESMTEAIKGALEESGLEKESIVGIGLDFTACTILPVTKDGKPLCTIDEFSKNPHSYVKLWKHHAGTEQAKRIETLWKDTDLLKMYGLCVSSEWELPKTLDIFENAPEIYKATDYFIEAGDWVIWQLCGNYFINKTAAGYKGFFQNDTYPDEKMLGMLNPGYKNYPNEKHGKNFGNLAEKAGELSPFFAKKFGLNPGIAVAVASVDAHACPPAADAIKAGQMTLIMGTSICHVLNSDKLKLVPGVGGIVKDGVINGLWGYEAGQSGVGDIFSWYIKNSIPKKYKRKAKALGLDIHQYLTELASKQKVGEHGLLALDWHSGNRSILVDQKLSGMILGMDLNTKPEDQYRAYIEATAFGTKKIIDNFISNGIDVNEMVMAGGLLKNKMLMQIYSDICDYPLSIMESMIGPALGSAIHAAVASGEYKDLYAATERMGKKLKNVYTPNKENVKKYKVLYKEYSTLHDYFGRLENPVMHKLKDLR